MKMPIKAWDIHWITGLFFLKPCVGAVGSARCSGRDVSLIPAFAF